MPPPPAPRNPTSKHDRGQEPPQNPDSKYDPYLTQNRSRFRQEPPPPPNSSSRLERQEPSPPYNPKEPKQDQPIPVLYQDGLDFRHRQEPPPPPSYTSEFNPPPHQSLSGFMQPVYVSHSYNAYKPSPYITGYEFAPPPPPRAMYHRRADPYAEGMYPTPRPYAGYDYSEDSHNGNNSNANISSMFSEENPNACAIS